MKNRHDVANIGNIGMYSFMSFLSKDYESE
jgi:hypothetical protein